MLGRCIEFRSGGMFINIQVEIPAGTLINMQFKLPDGPEAAILCSVEVT